MRVFKAAVAAVLLVVPSAAFAQPAERTLTPLEVAVACGPPTTMEMPSEPLRVIGAQDTVKRLIFNTGDLLILDGGTAKGVQLNQQFIVRRPMIQGVNRKTASGIQTLGWTRIVATNENTAIAKVDHLCDGIFGGDYLEPFVAPEIPLGIERDNPAGELDFTALGHVLSGVENMMSGGLGSLMLIDKGADQSMAQGARFAVYRDLHQNGIPLASIAEGVVLSVGKTMSLTKITRSRDAIVSGDYVVPRK